MVIPDPDPATALLLFVPGDPEGEQANNEEFILLSTISCLLFMRRRRCQVLFDESSMLLQMLVVMQDRRGAGIGADSKALALLYLSRFSE